MDVTTSAFLVLLACVGLERLLELRLSRRHQRDLALLGAHKRADPHYRRMIALHAGVLGGAALEVIFLRRPLIAPLAAAALLAFLWATALRWWVIRTLGTHWNTEVVDSATLGVVSKGPFRWIRHPNYLGVFVESLRCRWCTPHGSPRFSRPSGISRSCGIACGWKKACSIRRPHTARPWLASPGSCPKSSSVPPGEHRSQPLAPHRSWEGSPCPDLAPFAKREPILPPRSKAAPERLLPG